MDFGCSGAHAMWWAFLSFWGRADSNDLVVEDIKKIHILAHMYRLYRRKSSVREAYMYDVAAGYGLTKQQTREVITKPSPLPTLAVLSEAEKFEILCLTLQFMRLDKRVCSREMQFCERIAATMGYRAGLIVELSCYVYSDPSLCAKREVLKDICAFYSIEQ